MCIRVLQRTHRVCVGMYLRVERDTARQTDFKELPSGIVEAGMSRICRLETQHSLLAGFPLPWGWFVFFYGSLHLLV